MWRIPAPEKVKFFLWTTLHKSFLRDECCIIVVWFKRIFVLDPIRMLRRLYTTWNTVNLLLAFENLFTSWTHYSSKGISYTIGLVMTSISTLSFCLLADGCGALGTNSILRMKLYLSILWNNANLLVKYFIKHNMYHPTKTTMWNAQKRSNMILNVDDSSLSNPDVSDFGGSIRNVNGAWIHVYADTIGYSKILHAELMTIYHDLCMTWEFVIKDMICSSDSNSIMVILES